MDQNFLKAIRKLFSMVSPNSSPTRVLASVTAEAVVHLASRYLSAALGVPHEQKGLIGLFLQLDRVPYRQFPPAGSGIAATQAPTTFRSATSTMEERNMVHSDLMSPALPGTWAKFFQRWELKFFPTWDSTRSSQQPLTIHPSEPTHHLVIS